VGRDCGRRHSIEIGARFVVGETASRSRSAFRCHVVSSVMILKHKERRMTEWQLLGSAAASIIEGSSATTCDERDDRMMDDGKPVVQTG
jgi:hypothetical protein